MNHTLLSAFTFSAADGIVFALFILAVLVISIFMSVGKKSDDGKSDSESYFLAGRGLPWWLIGFSLIAANISTEQFIGMSGNASQCTGLAIASYEWIAAISLVIVAFAFVPMFLRCGIYTIPEFLEYRYNKLARTLMSLSMILILCGVTIAVVINSGALTIDVLFRGMSVFGIPINIVNAGWFIGLLAAVYVFTGGLKACAWADLLQGSGLLLGGIVIMWFAFAALGTTKIADMGVSPDYVRPAAYQGENLTQNVQDDSSAWQKFSNVNKDKLHMARPNNDPNIVWTTLLLGIWIPNLYYWGLNQYIMQRTLGAKSLAEGQKGIIFAAAMKLLIPFIIVFPGIIAFNLYHKDMAEQAETDKVANFDTWAAFTAIKDKPAEQKKLFKFDIDFAQLNTAKAQDVLAYNKAVLGNKDLSKETAEQIQAYAAANPKIQLDDNFNLYLENKTYLEYAAAVDYPAGMNPVAKYTRRLQENLGMTTATYPVQKELVGYKFDSAFPLLLKNLNIPSGFRGFVLAALLGAVISSLASMLNAASTIFTMDIYKEYIHKNASQGGLVFMGRICVILAMIAGCLISPILSDPRFGGLFKYIQEFQGFISPGILAVFVVGLLFTRVRGFYGVLGLIASPVIYGALMLVMPDVNFLNRMAITFVSILVVLSIMTLACPAAEEKKLPFNEGIELINSKGAMIAGAIVCIATAALYVVFM